MYFRNLKKNIYLAAAAVLAGANCRSRRSADNLPYNKAPDYEEFFCYLNIRLSGWTSGNLLGISGYPAQP